MRKYDIDNLRNYTILLLFPVHTFMIWNNFGEGFYIWVGENKICSTLIVLINPWFMPLLFVLAGMSARYALGKRTVKEFAKQRALKLLLPFVSGTAVLVPFQTWYARKYFDNYQGGFLDNWKYFFTHITDFSGYDGAFTPGHLWFILFLFIISMFSLILFRCLPYEKAAGHVQEFSAFAVLLLFVPVWLMYYIGNVGGFSIGKDLALYLIGYYILSNEAVLDRLERSFRRLVSVWAPGMLALAALYYRFSYYGDLWINFIGWISILVIIVFGRKYLNRKTGLTDYLNRASYPIYILHQSILVALAYYVVQLCSATVVQAVVICVGSFALTVLAYHVMKGIPVVRIMIGGRKGK